MTRAATAAHRAVLPAVLVLLAASTCAALAAAPAAGAVAPHRHGAPRATAGTGSSRGTALDRALHDAVAAAVGRRATVGNPACGSASLSPSHALQGGQGTTLSVDWQGSPSNGGCNVLDDSCTTAFGSCDGGYWVVGVFCSTLAARNLAGAQGDCDLNNIVVLTDDSSGPDNGGTGTSYNTCTTVATLGSIFGGLPGTLQCLTDGSTNGWSESWPTGSTTGSAAGVVEETGTGVPFRPAAAGVDCPPSAANIAAGALPDTCAFVLMPINISDTCAFWVCVPGSENEVTGDYMAVLLDYAAAPTITSASSATVVAGSPVDLAVQATGDPAPAIGEGGALPAGLRFAAGVLRGTPGQAGSFPLTFTAGNGIAPDAVQSFLLTVEPKPPPPPPPPQGYWLASADGHVGAAGDATAHGSLSTARGDPVVGVAAARGGGGYWEVTRDGRVGAFGSAAFSGDLVSRRVAASDVVAIAPTADGQGYWLIGADGGMFAFGDARYHGSLPGLHVHVNDVVGMVATPNGRGYLLVGSDGGVFVFGGRYHGSLPGLHVRVDDVAGIIPTGLETGYVLVGSDGGAFVFGKGSGYEGSLPGRGVHVHDVVGLALTPSERGYWMAEADGVVRTFGDARSFPEPAGVAANLPVVSIAAS